MMAKLDFDAVALDQFNLDLQRLGKLTNEDHWQILAPAGELLVQKFRETIARTFSHQKNHPAGDIQSLSDSIEAQNKYGADGAYIQIVPDGGHHRYNKRVKTIKVTKVFGHVSKSGTRTRKTKGGLKTERADAVGFVLEYGSPGRHIKPYHWMENTMLQSAAEVEEALQQGFDAFCEENGL